MKSKKKTVSKIIPAGCLVAALMFFLIPCANAADIISVSTAAELEAALQSAADGDTIRLTANIDYTGVLSILDKTIVLDLQNYNLNVISDGGYAVYVGNGGISELKGSGEFVVAGEKFGINAENGGFATVTRVEVGMADEGGRGVSAEGLSRLTVLEDISGYTGVYALNSEVIVGGSIYGDNAGVYAVNGAKVTVEGGAEGGHYGVYAAGDGTVVTVKGDSIATIEDGKGVAAYYGANVAVEYARGSSFGVYAKSN